MRGMRIFLFTLMIVLGLAGGLAYGWAINPVQYQDTFPEKLHPAYKADYVLMVAEIYQMDADLEAASQRLSMLGSQSPANIVVEGILTARELNYDPGDLELMNRLAEGLQGSPASPDDGDQP